jgi:ATP-dependent Clp protease ATP-binding subunit ClpC
VFERFTDRARRVVVLAQEESRSLNHAYIGTEHLLLGLVHEGEGVAAKALEALGISLESVRAEVEEIVGRGTSEVAGHIPFTPRAKKALELSLREALNLGHNYIGTEHVLLGLISEAEGVAARVLVGLGADLPRVRNQVKQLLSGYSGSPRLRWTTGDGCVLCGRTISDLERFVTGTGGIVCSSCVARASEALTRSQQREINLPPPDPGGA